MSLEEVKKSGLLELYVAGLLSEDELQIVEGCLSKYPELKEELHKIENAYMQYGHIKGKEVSNEKRKEIFDFVIENGSWPTQAMKDKSKPYWKYVSIILSLVSVISLWQLFNANSNIVKLTKEVEAQSIYCDSLNRSQQQVINRYKALEMPGNRPIKFNPTETYNDLQLVLHLNEDTKSNYLQAFNLPTLSSEDTFQLWSLKDGQNPIPLNSFTFDNSSIIPIAYEDNTGTYAITIEKKPGAKTPNLDQLIGTAGV